METTGVCTALDLPVLGCLGTGHAGIDFFLTVMSALAILVFGLSMKLLGGETWRLRAGLWLIEARWSTAYAGLMRALLDRLQRVFGRRWSWQAFDMCFRIAVVYALILVGFRQVIVNERAAASAWVAGLAVYFACLAWFFFWSRAIRRRHRARAAQATSRGRRIWARVREQLFYLLIFVVVVLIIAVLMTVADLPKQGGDPSGSPSRDAGDAILYSAFSGAIFAAASGVGSAAIAGTLLGAGLSSGATFVFAVLVGALNLVLPLLNAALDWPSWAATRWLMRRLEVDAGLPGILRRLGAVALHLVVDLVIALACLFGMAILLVHVDNLVYGSLRESSDLRYWRHFFPAAREAPFSADGIIITLMLVSTLVPTAIHLFFAIFALAAIRPPFRTQIVGWLDDRAGGGEWGNRAIVSAYLTTWILFAVAVLWGASVVIVEGLDWLWLRLGWGLASDPYPFWASIFRAAESVVLF